ncbi:HPr family phosphocarrier protein [Enemella sp. A6]|uniref:HPr family phosphocarrier protein n=1 Tax=Enemella sp. A6 TaxID=3440152 RepID=UPI003EBD5C1C
MSTRDATIAAPEGLHARPAAEFVKAVKDSGVQVTIATEGKDPVPADSILAVLGLGVKQGQVVTLTADGDGAEAALDALVTQLESDH